MIFFTKCPLRQNYHRPQKERVRSEQDGIKKEGDEELEAATSWMNGERGKRFTSPFWEKVQCNVRDDHPTRTQKPGTKPIHHDHTNLYPWFPFHFRSIRPSLDHLGTMGKSGWFDGWFGAVKVGEVLFWGKTGCRHALHHHGIDRLDGTNAQSIGEYPSPFQKNALIRLFRALIQLLGCERNDGELEMRLSCQDMITTIKINCLWSELALLVSWWGSCELEIQVLF